MRLENHTNSRRNIAHVKWHIGNFQDYVRHLWSFNQNIYHLLLHKKAYIYRTFISQYFWMIKMVMQGQRQHRTTSTMGLRMRISFNFQLFFHNLSTPPCQVFTA
jgi:hypothetical protein